MTTRKRKPPACSLAECEATTKVERSAWVEARERSERLLYYSEKLHAYLRGESGGPDAAESAYREADAIRYALNTALSGRLVRAEEQRMRAEARKRTTRK